MAKAENAISELRIKVMHAAGCSEYDVPCEITVQTLISELVSQLLLPRIQSKGGQLLEYRLDSKELARRLEDNETLASAAISPNDTLLLTVSLLAGSPTPAHKSPIHVVKSSIGLSFDDLKDIPKEDLLKNEPALTMALHHHHHTLVQLATLRDKLADAKDDAEQLSERLKDRKIATLLLILGQVQTGFGINLITASSRGGWFVFLAGMVLSIGAFFLPSFLRRKTRRESEGVSYHTPEARNDPNVGV